MKCKNPKHAGFTLTEILVVVVIITMLVALSLAGLSAIRKQSNIDKTRRTIQKIHVLLMKKLSEYETKRVKVDAKDPGEASIARLNAIRDLMRMEMPDRYNDIDDEHSEDPPATPVIRPPIANINTPATLRTYFRKYKSARENYDKDIVDKHAAAELLYMIIMNMPDASEQFAEFEIGDVDGDGLREFIDGWGNPIRFLRWPAGFVESNGVLTNLQNTSQSDPLDPLNLIPEDYALVPLVYSAGPDKLYGINIKDGHKYAFSDGKLRTCEENEMGSPVDENGVSDTHIDNITNHALDFGK